MREGCAPDPVFLRVLFGVLCSAGSSHTTLGTRARISETTS